MNDHEKILNLIYREDSKIVGPIITVSTIKKKNIDDFVSVFDIEKGEILSHDDNETLVMLRKGDIKEHIFTTDKRAIFIAKEKKKAQEELIGIRIIFKCAAIWNEPDKQHKAYIEKLIDAYNDFKSWKFEKEETGNFKITVTIGKDESVDKTINEVQLFLDMLSFYHGIGFMIQNYSVFKLPRYGMASAIQQVKRPKPLSMEEINSLKEKMKNSSDLMKLALHSLNISHYERESRSRVLTLWAAVEEISLKGFNQQKLLSKDEIKEIMKAVQNIPTLKNDLERIKKLNDVISNPQRLPLKSRNERIASFISNIKGISIEEAKKAIGKISKLRGKLAHTASVSQSSNEELEKWERFLQKVLKGFISQNIRQKSIF